MAKTDGVTLLDVLKGAKQSDLDAVAAQIDELEKQLDTLHAVKKLLTVRLHGKPERKAPTKKPKGKPWANRESETDEADTGGGSSQERSGHRANVRAYLRKAGAAKPAVIAADCNVPPGSITYVLNHPDFVKGLDGFVKLAS